MFRFNSVFIQSIESLSHGIFSLQINMAEANLDALLLELDASDSEPDGAPPDPGVDGVPPDPDVEGVPPDPGQNVLPPDPGPDRGPGQQQQQAPASPVQMSPIIGKYISSSSAKRRAIKTNNCCFCPLDIDRDSMAEHLRRNDRCRTLYQRKLHVKTTDAVLCRLYECIYCADKAPKLFIHLEQKEECRVKYLDKFNVLSSRQAVDQVMKLRRTGYKSRRSLSRAIENEKAKKQKRNILRNEPPETALNAHLHKTLFSNYRTCLNCLSHLLSAEEVTPDSDCVKSGLYSLEDKSYLQRFGKFWVCSYCKAGEEPPRPDIPMLEMSQTIQNSERTFFPKRAVEEEEEEEDHQEAVAGVALENVFIMLPYSTECLKEIPAGPDMKSLTSFQIQSLVYGESFDLREASLLYQHQLLKYHRAKNYGDLFFGKVESIQTKTLAGVKMCSQESKINGSSGWRRSQHQDLKWKREQLGDFCLKISVRFPVHDETSISTCLAQRGRVLTATLQGDETGEMRRKYFVHTGSTKLFSPLT